MQIASNRLAPWRLLVALALAVGIYAAATVVPAAAATNSHSASECEVTIFDGLKGLDSAAAAARGDVVREPALDQVLQEMPASAKGKGGKSFRATVPVYFHVVHANGVGNISQAVIDEQMRVLNAAFAGFYGGPSSGFAFKLAGVTRTNNTEWHLA